MYDVDILYPEPRELHNQTLLLSKKGKSSIFYVKSTIQGRMPSLRTLCPNFAILGLRTLSCCRHGYENNKSAFEN